MTEVQEVGTMNIFFVIDGEVITPATDGAILKGITRKNFITILRDQGYKVTERKVEIQEIVEAHDAGKLQEMFGAGTAAIVSHVSELQFKDKLMVLPDVADRKIGPMLKQYIDGLRTGRVADKFGWVVKL
jgi:branched-chain amino acid aminotransferase